MGVVVLLMFALFNKLLTVSSVWLFWPPPFPAGLEDLQCCNTWRACAAREMIYTAPKLLGKNFKNCKCRVNFDNFGFNLGFSRKVLG
jgi:hypothetical protein